MNPSKHVYSDVQMPLASDRSNPNQNDAPLKNQMPTNITIPTTDLISNGSLMLGTLNMTLNTSVFRKENKQSIFNNYDMLEVLGKGILLIKAHSGR